MLSYAAVVEPPGFAPGLRVYQTRVLLLDDGSLWLLGQGTLAKLARSAFLQHPG